MTTIGLLSGAVSGASEMIATWSRPLPRTVGVAQVHAWGAVMHALMVDASRAVNPDRATGFR